MLLLMARQMGTELIGTIDNLIFYKWRDVYAVRTKPAEVKQSAASIAQRSVFGKAAHLGKVLRQLLTPVLPYVKDRDAMRRWEKAIAGWLRTSAPVDGKGEDRLPGIEGFEFNKDCPFYEKVKVSIGVERRGEDGVAVLLPSVNVLRDMVAPEGTCAIMWKLQVVRCGLERDENPESVGVEWKMRYDDVTTEAREVVVPVTSMAGCVVIVVVALVYTVAADGVETEAREKEWLPAGVVGGLWG